MELTFSKINLEYFKSKYRFSPLLLNQMQHLKKRDVDRPPFYIVDVSQTKLVPL